MIDILILVALAAANLIGLAAFAWFYRTAKEIERKRDEIIRRRSQEKW